MESAGWLRSRILLLCSPHPPSSSEPNDGESDSNDGNDVAPNSLVNVPGCCGPTGSLLNAVDSTGNVGGSIVSKSVNAHSDSVPLFFVTWQNPSP